MVFEKEREKAADAHDSYEGTIVKVQGDEIIVRNLEAKVGIERKFTVDRGVRITIDNMSKEIGDLRVGLKVGVKVEQGLASVIEASTKDVSTDGKNKK